MHEAQHRVFDYVQGMETRSVDPRNITIYPRLQNSSKSIPTACVRHTFKIQGCEVATRPPSLFCLECRRCLSRPYPRFQLERSKKRTSDWLGPDRNSPIQTINTCFCLSNSASVPDSIGVPALRKAVLAKAVLAAPFVSQLA